MIRVTFAAHSKILGKTFNNVEVHASIEDARLRASALGWTIWKVETIREAAL